MKFDLATVLVALFGGGTLVGVLAFFFSPATQRLAFRRKDRDAIISRLETVEKRLQAVEEHNKNLTTAVAVLIQHDDSMREIVLRYEPNARIPTCAELLRRVGVSLHAILSLHEVPPEVAAPGAASPDNSAT